MSKITPEPKSHFRELVTTVVIVVLIMCAILAALVYAGQGVPGTATSCTVKGLNEQGTNGGIIRTLYAEGCNGDPDVEMFYLNPPVAPLEERAIYDSIVIGDTYDFEIKRPRVSVFAKVASVISLTPSK